MTIGGFLGMTRAQLLTAKGAESAKAEPGIGRFRL